MATLYLTQLDVLLRGDGLHTGQFLHAGVVFLYTARPGHSQLVARIRPSHGVQSVGNKRRTQILRIQHLIKCRYRYFLIIMLGRQIKQIAMMDPIYGLSLSGRILDLIS